MRLGDLAGKEVVNLLDATKLCTIKQAEALVNTDTGRIESILIPYGESAVWRGRPKMLSIPWRAVKRMGRDLIIVEIRTPETNDRRDRIAIRGEEV